MQLLIYIGTFCFDFFFSNLVILNLVVFVWRIIWDTQDIYLKSNVCLNSMISITSSLIILVLVKIKQMKNAKHFSLMNNEENADPYYIKNQKYSPQLKIFILIFSFANINLWRGFWNFTLFYTNESMMGILMIGIISLLALIAMNRVCALVSVPYIYAKDTCNTAYQIDPDTIKPNVCLKIEQELKIKPTKWSFFIHFLQEFLADIFTIEAWRSLWSVYDKYMYSDDLELSAYLSMLQGAVCYFVLHFFNKKINSFILKKTMEEINRLDNSLDNSLDEENDDGVVANNTNNNPYNHNNNIHSIATSKLNAEASCGPKRLKECVSLNNNKNINHLSLEINSKELSNNLGKSLSISNRIFLFLVFILGFVGTVNLWRGLWMLQLIYCYPRLVESELLNQSFLNLIYMFFSLLILWMLNLTSSLLSRASCEDDFFIAEKNYIVKHNNFKDFFLKKIKSKINLRYKNDSKVKTVLRKIFYRKKRPENIITAPVEFKLKRLIYQPINMEIKLNENFV